MCCTSNGLSAGFAAGNSCIPGHFERWDRFGSITIPPPDIILIIGTSMGRVLLAAGSLQLLDHSDSIINPALGVILPIRSCYARTGSPCPSQLS